jgi:hypothetical protein
MHILAFFLPCIVMLIIGRPFAAIVCFFLQLTLIGWIPAAVWAAYAFGEHQAASRYAHTYYARSGYYR